MVRGRAPIAALFLTLCLVLQSHAQYGVIGPSGGAARNPGIQYPWRFGILMDTHTAWGYGACSGVPNTVPLRACVDTLNTIGVDFAILNGDWGGGGPIWVNHEDQIDSLYSAFLNRTSFPVWPVLGNHEAHRDDSLTFGNNPYTQAIARFQEFFQGQDYYAKNWKNLRFIATQNNVNYDVLDPDDYRVNNPFNYAAMGGVAGYDYDGIHSAAGAQRVWLSSALSARNASHWLVVGGHRGIFGSDANNPTRYNYNASRSGRYMKQVSDALSSDERALALQGDQHLPLWLTHAINDSAIASATGKGVYYLTLASGSGARIGDSTEVFGGAGLQAFVYHDDVTSLRNRGRTTGGWLESLTNAQDPGLRCQFTWGLATVYGDVILLEIFRTWTSADAGAPGYSGAGTHKRVSWHTLSRDVSEAVSTPPDDGGDETGLEPTPDPLSTEADAFVAYCDSVFTTADEPLIAGTFGSTPEFIEAGDWVYPSRNSASVAFETNLPCVTAVEYGTTAAYGSQTTTPDRHYYHHLHHLTGLSPSTTYHYRLAATDDSGVTVYSSDRTLTTGAFASAIEVPGALSGPPYNLNSAGATYILTQNIASDTRGVFISANNITFDMNGFTITYDNGAPVGTGLNSTNSTSGVHFWKDNANSQGTLVRILNGTIKQGSHNSSGNIYGEEINPVAIYEGKVEVAGLIIKYKGGDINGIHNQWGTLHAHHNTVHDGGIVITHRGQGIKAIYSHMSGSTTGEGIHHNTVRRARHQGIMLHASDTGTSGVWDNEVWLDSYATNSYCVGAANTIDHNKMFGSGYHVVGTSFLDQSGAQITDNFIFLQGEAPTLRDDEYDADASVIGVRLTQYDGATFVYDGYLYSGNTIIVKGRDGTLSVRGTQLASSPYITNCRFINNVVKCEIQDAETRGACINAQGTNDAFSSTEAQIIYEGNTLLTNDVFVRFGDQYACGGNHQLRENTLTKFGSLASYKAIRMGYFSWDSYGNRFIDSVLGSGVSLADVSVEGTPGGVRDYAVGHSLWIEARGAGGTPLASTVITVYDDAGLSYTATTNGSGIARLELIEDFYAAGAGASSITHTTRSGHEIRTAGYSAHVVTVGEFAMENNEGSPLVVQFVP